MQTPAPIPPLPPLPASYYLEDVLLPALGIGLAAFFVWLLYRTINRWLDRRGAGGRGDAAVVALRAEVDELRRRVAAGEELQLRVAELEERLDFAERVLAQQRERQRLPPAGEQRA